MSTQTKVPWEGSCNKGEYEFLFCSEKCADDFGSDCFVERGLWKFGAEPLQGTVAETWGEGAPCENCGEEVTEAPND